MRKRSYEEARSRMMADHAISGRTFPSRTSWPTFTSWLTFVPAFLTLLIGLCSETALPGIYMDGVNPD
jgi:membrane protein YqaA with SNARE-associated domain